MGAGGPTPKAGPAAPGVAGAYRQRCVEIDDCQIQNPAYMTVKYRTRLTVLLVQEEVLAKARASFGPY